MSAGLVCWKCGASLAGVKQPFSRRAECPACHTDVHVCRMCVFWNPRISDRCEEPRAEHPRDDTRANFCDYFKPRLDAHARPDAAKTGAARSRLDEMFGGKSSGASGSAQDKLNNLFGGKDGKK
jgi:hypothetical protein